MKIKIKFFIFLLLVVTTYSAYSDIDVLSQAEITQFLDDYINQEIIIETMFAMTFVLDKDELPSDYKYGLANSYEEMVVYVTNNREAMKKLMSYGKLDIFNTPTVKVKGKVLGVFKPRGFSLYEGSVVIMIGSENDIYE